MKKLVLVGGAALGAALCARRAARGCSRCDVEARIERLPENAPRKWLFRNISAIRTNSERIIELLETERAAASEDTARAAV